MGRKMTQAFKDRMSKNWYSVHGPAHIKHGQSHHPLYVRWTSMMHRCYRPDDKRYHRYGGRGIKVCKRWHKRENYIADMFPTYSDGLILDRRDNDKGYSPENCRWVTREVSANNTSNVRLIEYNGKKQSVADWSRELGIKRATLHARIKGGKMPLDKVFSRETYKNHTYQTINLLDN